MILARPSRVVPPCAYLDASDGFVQLRIRPVVDALTNFGPDDNTLEKRPIGVSKWLGNPTVLEIDMSRIGASRAPRMLLGKHHIPVAIVALPGRLPPELAESAKNRMRAGADRRKSLGQDSLILRKNRESPRNVLDGASRQRIDAAIIIEEVLETGRHIVCDRPEDARGIVEPHGRDPGLEPVPEPAGLGRYDQWVTYLGREKRRPPL